MSRSEMDVDNVFLQKQIDSIKRRHERAEESYYRVKIFQNNTDRNLFILPSFSQIGEIYKVRRISLNNHACNMYCDVCEACVHEFSCDCPDASNNSNFCKHMHVLCLNNYQASNLNSAESRRLEATLDEIHGNAWRSTVSNYQARTTVRACLRQEAKAEVNGLASVLDKFTSERTYKEIIQTIRNLRSKIETLEGSSTNVSSSSVSSSSTIDPCT